MKMRKKNKKRLSPLFSILIPGSFDACKNATAPIMAMLGHSELTQRSQMQVWKPRNPMIAERYLKRIEMSMVCWLQYVRE